MPLIRRPPSADSSRCMAGHRNAPAICDDAVEQICRLYPEIASWHPALIADAWQQWCELKSLPQAVPEERDEAFPLYLVRLIRNRMEVMNTWR